VPAEISGLIVILFVLAAMALIVVGGKRCSTYAPQGESGTIQ
jgi:hypothetical protein